MAPDPKDQMIRYLSVGHDALLWKLDGLSEYDVRRPLTPTGTNLLGLVKHLAYVELGYFGETFGRSTGVEFPDGPNADMYATANESRDEIVALFERARSTAVNTIENLGLDAEGTVAWWPDEVNPVTVQLISVHMIAELHRHTGHADILRELIDGAAGLRPGGDNLPELDAATWREYHDQLEAIAAQFR